MSGSSTAPSPVESVTRQPSGRRQLAARASWNLIDQAVSSASNFALSILIARSVDRYAFGAFAVSFTLFSFLIGIVRAIGRYPLVIRFGDTSQTEFRRATQAATGSVCSFGLLSGLLTALVGLSIGGEEGAALTAMGMVLPFVLLQDMWRGVLIGAGRPAAATLNDAIWTVSQFAALGYLLAIGVDSVPALMITWGLTGGLAAAFGVVQTKAVPRLQDTRRWLVDHWDQIGFFLAEWVLVLGAMQGSLLLIATWASVQEVGALRGAQVLLGPLNLVAASVFEFAIPELVRRPHLSARDRSRAAYLVSGFLVLLTLSWGGVLLIMPAQFGRALLGDTWSTTRSVLPAAILWTCAIVLSTGPAVVLRALGRARVSFQINALTAPLLVALSLVGLRFYGAVGAAAGFALANWLIAPLWWRRMRGAVAEAAHTAAQDAGTGSSEQSPLRLLVVMGTQHENGGHRVVLELARRWNASGTSAQVFVLQPARDRVAAVDSIVPIKYGYRRQTRLRYAWPLVLLRLSRSCRKVDFVISCSETGTSLLFGFIAARLTRRRFAVIVHSSLNAALRDWMPSRFHSMARRIHRKSDATVCVSSRLLPELLATTGVREDTLRVIPNGIDTDRVTALARQPSQPAAPDGATIVASGRLSHEKGFDLLIRAHDRVRRAGVAHRLLILGEGPERINLLRLVHELDVGDTVELPGFRENPFPDIVAADLFCLPSRYEGFPLAVLEALALGVPIVASECGSDLLADGKYGDVVATESVEELATAIERHLREPERLRAAVLHGPQLAREFAWSRIAEEYRRFFAEMRAYAGRNSGGQKSGRTSDHSSRSA